MHRYLHDTPTVTNAYWLFVSPRKFKSKLRQVGLVVDVPEKYKLRTVAGLAIRSRSEIRSDRLSRL